MPLRSPGTSKKRQGKFSENRVTDRITHQLLKEVILHLRLVSQKLNCLDRDNEILMERNLDRR